MRAGDKYVHAVVLCADVVLSDNGFSLLPHEERTITYRSVGDAKEVDLSVMAYTLA